MNLLEQAREMRGVLLLWIFAWTVLVLWDVNEYRGLVAKFPFNSASGKVVELNCRPHGEYLVQYNVHGQSLIGSPAEIFMLANCNALAINQTVMIWVSRNDMNYVSFIPPDQALARKKREIVFEILAFLLGPLWLFLGPRIFKRGSSHASAKLP